LTQRTLFPARLPARLPFRQTDRFDLIVVGVITFLVIAIGGVILYGDHVSGPLAIPPAVVYLGPIDAIQQNLWQVDPTGTSAPRQITNALHGILDFDVSRTGLIVYSDQTDNGGTRLMQLDPATGHSTVLYACPDATCMTPAWRPDGKVIAFDHSALNIGTNLPPGAPRIWLYDLATGQASGLYADNQRLGYTPRWSPDGKKLAFIDSSAGQIIVHDLATNTDSSFDAVQGEIGTFSPNSQSIWFPKVVSVAGGQYATHITIVDLSSDPPLQHDLVPDDLALDDADPMWLPDSKALLVLRIPADRLNTQERQIYRVDATNGTAVALIDEPGYTHSNLSLNAAGDQITFQRLQLGSGVSRPEIWIYNLKTHATRKLADNGNVPRWLP